MPRWLIAVILNLGLPLTAFAQSVGTPLGIGAYNILSPIIRGSGRSTAQTGAVASVAAYTLGGADGTFEVSSNVNVTAAVTANFTTTVAYTDETNTSRTVTLTFSQLNGTLITAITNTTGVSSYQGIPLQIRCKSGTAITIATTGTFTSVTYNVQGYITQLG